MRSSLVKCRNLIKYIQCILLVIFFIGITILVKIPNTNKVYKIILIIFILYGGFTVLRTKKMHFILPVLSYLLFSIICFLSIYWSAEIYLDTVIVVLLVSLVSATFYIIINTREKIDMVFFAILVAVIAEFLYCISQLGLRDVLHSRMVLEGFNSNQVGTEIAFASIICLYFWTESHKTIMLGIYSVLFLFCLLTGSRAALILFVAGGGIFFFHFSIGKSKIQNRIIIGGIFLIIVLFLLFKVEIFYNLIGKRISQEMIMPIIDTLVGDKSTKTISNSSNHLRWNMIKYGFDFFRQHPLLGAGIDNYRVLIANTDLGYVSYAHNNYIELLTDVGITGFCVYYFPYLLVGAKILKHQFSGTPLLRMSLSIWVCLLVDDMTGVNYHMMFQRVVFMILLCIVYIKPEKLLYNRERTHGREE